MHTIASPSQMILSKKTGLSLVRLENRCNSNTDHNLDISTSASMIAIDVEVSANRTYWIDEKRKVNSNISYSTCHCIILHLCAAGNLQSEQY